jgi:serpin B
MNDYLKALGMKDAFDPVNADFTGIAKLETQNMYISKVFHKTHIEVDRKGTKAAAVTTVEIDAAGVGPSVEPKRVICDRPYVYAIVDTVTMNPIFIGTVNSIN